MHEDTNVRDLTNCLNCIGYGAILRQYVNEAIKPQKYRRQIQLVEIICHSAQQWELHVLEVDHATQ